MLEIIAIVLIGLFLPEVVVPAALIAAASSWTFWPVFAVIWASSILLGAVVRGMINAVDKALAA